MRVVFTADFEIPDNVVIHDGGVFECEGVIFEPELYFNCVEVDVNNPEELIQFPNDIWSVREYEIKHISVNSDFNLSAPKQWSIADGAFMPQGLKKGKIDFEMAIFDQAGNKIFTTTSRVKGWDGKLANGAMASSGSTFSYRVIMSNDRTQELKYFNGTFIVFP